VKKRFFLLSLSLVLLWGFLVSYAQEQEVVKSDDLTVSAKEFVELLAKEDFAEAVKNFDSTMKGALPEEKLREAWKSLTQKVGPFRKQISVRTEKLWQLDIVFVTCEFEKSILDVKVVFNNRKEISGLWFVPNRPPAQYKPPTYAKPDSFCEKEVQVAAGEWALPGTLTLPVDDGPFPALVLVHGSGPHDRDETIYSNKPFRDLAWGLASRGIAVLRYEKRTKVHLEKILPLGQSITVKEETIDDALAAVSLLRKREEIDAEKIFVLGHSLGGMLIPRIAEYDPQITGFIVLAGTTRPLEEVILEQMTYIFSLDGDISENEKEQLEKVKLQIAKLKDPKLSEPTPSTDLLGVPPKYWLDLRGYNPAEAAQAIKQPMLILQGGRDYQATMEDFQGWKNHLSSQKNVEFRLYPKLNHLFVEGEGKSTPAEYLIPGNVKETVINDIANWIKKQ